MQPQGSGSTPDVDAAIGQRICARRDTLGLSLAGLACAVGVPTETLATIEAGRAPVTAALLLRIADALETSAAALLGEMGRGEGFLLGLDDPQVVAMLQAFAAIPAQDVRAAILALVQEMAETPDFRPV